MLSITLLIGEPVHEFVKCLEQHASDHMLDECADAD